MQSSSLRTTSINFTNVFCDSSALQFIPCCGIKINPIIKKSNSWVIYLTPQSQQLLRQVLSSLSLTKTAEQPTLPCKKVRIQGGKDSEKYLLIPESTEDHIRNKSNETEVLQKSHCSSWREKSEPVLSSRKTKTKAKLVICTWEERSTRVLSRLLCLFNIPICCKREAAVEALH